MNTNTIQRKDFNYILAVCMPCRLYSHCIHNTYQSVCFYLFIKLFYKCFLCHRVCIAYTKVTTIFFNKLIVRVDLYKICTYLQCFRCLCVLLVTPRPDVSNNSVVSEFSESVHRTQIFRYVYDCFMTSQSTHVTLCLAHMEARGLCFVPIQQLFVLTSTILMLCVVGTGSPCVTCNRQPVNIEEGLQTVP